MILPMLLPLLAQQGAEATRGYSISWFVILACIALGLIVALYPAKRSDDVRKVKEE